MVQQGRVSETEAGDQENHPGAEGTAFTCPSVVQESTEEEFPDVSVKGGERRNALADVVIQYSFYFMIPAGDQELWLGLVITRRTRS